ncbi:MAG: glycosyltransferase family 4 protein [Pseudomonadota bacterium]
MTPGAGPRIVVVMPRNMSFGPRRASSIDLCAYDFVRTSRYRETTTVVAEHVDEPFEGLAVSTYPKGDKRAQVARIAALSPDLIVVHQHVPSAMRIARQIRDVPVIVHRHNAIKPPSWLGSRLRYRWIYGHLAGLIFVSDFCTEHFRAAWPRLQLPVVTVHNALEMGPWQPRGPEDRERVIAYTGRLDPLKGIVELAEALPQVLAERPDWRAHLVLSRQDRWPSLRPEVEARIAPVAGQVDLSFDVPFARVVEVLSSAAIAVVPTVSEEPFGRAALEAMAGGAALASAMTGGLPEVVGDCAVPVDPITPMVLAGALGRLCDDDALRGALAVRGLDRARAGFELADKSAEIDAFYDRVLAERRVAA